MGRPLRYMIYDNCVHVLKNQTSISFNLNVLARTMFALGIKNTFLLPTRLWISRIMTGGSGGAIYLVGGLTLNGSDFVENAAGEDGLATGSYFCGSSLVRLENVGFINNGLYSPSGLYQAIPTIGVVRLVRLLQRKIPLQIR